MITDYWAIFVSRLHELWDKIFGGRGAAADKLDLDLDRARTDLQYFAEYIYGKKLSRAEMRQIWWSWAPIDKEKLTQMQYDASRNIYPLSDDRGDSKQALRPGGGLSEHITDSVEYLREHGIPAITPGQKLTEELNRKTTERLENLGAGKTIHIHSPNQELADKFTKALKGAWNSAVLNCEQELELMYPILATALKNTEGLHDEIVSLMGKEIHVGTKSMSNLCYDPQTEEVAKVTLDDSNISDLTKRAEGCDNFNKCLDKIIENMEFKPIELIKEGEPDDKRYHIWGRILPRDKAERHDWTEIADNRRLDTFKPHHHAIIKGIQF